MATTMTEKPDVSRLQFQPWEWLRWSGMCYAVILVCHLPMVWLQFQRAWQIDSYRYYPFLLLAIVGLSIHRWWSLPERPVYRPTWSSVATLLVGLCLLAGAVAVRSPWLGTVSAFVSLMGVLLSFGVAVALRLLPVWLLLWLLLPLPFRLDQRLALAIQDLTSKGGSQLLDLWGLDHVLAGFVLELPGRQLPVEELGGGIASLFIAISTAAVLAVWLRRGILHGCLLVASSVLWGIGTNMVGVALTVMFLADGRMGAMTEASHWWFGTGLFVALLILLFSTDGLLLFLFESPFMEPIDDDIEEPQTTSSGVSNVSSGAAGPRLGVCLLAAGSLAACAWQVIAWESYGMQSGVSAQPVAASGSTAGVSWSDVLTAESLPPLQGDWRSTDFATVVRPMDSDLGRFALAWRYARERDEAVLSVEFPFESWQEPARVYDVRGWEIESRQVLTEEEGAEPLLEVRMRDGGGRRGYLLVRQFTEWGEAIPPPADSGWSLAAWFQSLGEQILKRFGNSEPMPVMVKISLLITGDLPLDQERQAEVRRAFRLSVEDIIGLLWQKEA
jgi:exosortase